MTQPGTGLFITYKKQEVKNAFIKIIVCDVWKAKSYFGKNI
jgi:hypothetical protein